MKFLSIPNLLNTNYQDLLAVFALFLHRTHGQELVFIETDKSFAKTILQGTKDISYSNFKENIEFVNQIEHSTPYFFGNKLNKNLGILFINGEVQLYYNSQLFDDNTIKRYGEHIYRISLEAYNNPNFCVKSFCYISKTEKDLILNKWNQTDKEFFGSTLLHQYIEEQSALNPEAIAVRFCKEEISYYELNSRANQVANYLRSQGIVRDNLIAICMERSIELVIGLLGILKAGGAYVPIDPSYPDERLSYVLLDSQAKIFLVSASTTKRFSNLLIQKFCFDDECNLLSYYSKENPVIFNQPEDLCYVIYTSGSTGKPKGVGNVHKGVVNRILWMQDQYKLKPSDRVLQKTPFGFDVSVWEFFWPLMTGSILIMAEPGIHKDAYALANLIENEQVTTVHFVPSMLNIFLEAEVSHKCYSLERVFVSGEALTYELQNKFFKNYMTTSLYNLYGPTEASIDVTYWNCKRNDTRTIVPIGYPIANIQIYILDAFLQPVAIGVIGELFIGGMGLARCYIHKEELTKEKFISNPFVYGERLYRTGDLCRFLSDGAIEYLGRIDNQIKLRGFRIELGEIETVIRQHREVNNAVVIAQQDNLSGHKYLAAYIIANNDHRILENKLVDSLKNTVPEYMIPSTFVFLKELPISPNGKLDLKKLPKPTLKRIQQDYILPDNESESLLLLIWQEVLGFKEISTQDSFFSLGGHSLQAMQLVVDIRKKLKKHISLPEIFSYQTIQQQSTLISTRPNINNEEAKFVNNNNHKFEPFPLTDIQKAYLVGRTNSFALGEIKSHIYIENTREEIDVLRLEKALNILISRHGMLNAIILEDGTQKVLTTTPYYSILVSNQDILDVRKSILDKFRNDTTWPLFEVRVTNIESNKVVIHFYFDLLIADGTGLEVIFTELSSLYENSEEIVKPPSISYRDTILYLNRESESFELSKSYWFNRISSLPDAPDLPLRSRATDDNCPFIRRKGQLSSSEWKSFQNRALAIGVTPAVLLLTVYGEVLKTWSQSAHFTINMMFFNRPLEHQDINRIVGNFSTTLLLEMDLRKNMTFEDKARKIQKQLLQDLEHSEFNGIKVLNEFNRLRGGSRAAAMPVVFACALNIKSKEELGGSGLFKWYGSGVSYSQLETPQVYFDHQVFEDEDKSFCFFWDVRDGYFPDGMIDAMFNLYSDTLKEVALNINFPDHLIPKIDKTLIAETNSTANHSSYGYLHLDVFEQGLIRPTKIALITSYAILTYKEMLLTSLYLKNQLDAYGFLANDFIAIIMNKGWEQVVAALAVHAVGAAYIPIDKTLPESRIKQILTISKCKAIITEEALDFLIDIPIFLVKEVQKENIFFSVPNVIQKTTDLAYVIFTSGSTGLPKGVMVEHQAALNTIEAINYKYNITADDCAFAISSFSFDLSVYDIFGILRVGGSIYIPTAEEVKRPDLWYKIIREQKITIWNSAPALMQIFIEQLGSPSNQNSTLRLIMMSGDWIPLNLPENIRKYFKTKIVSLGGATEASIWSNSYEIVNVNQYWLSIPYGKPLSNQNLYILDENLELKPIYATGIIYIGGRGLARGYLHDIEKTTNNFFFHNKLKQNLYRTGDLGRLLPDGNIEILGREDLQVKIQGYRIELEEIEYALQNIPEIKQAIVRIIGNKHEAKTIVAFFTANSNLDTVYIKEYLEKKIPFYMIPNQFLQVELFPLNMNGKIDIKKLFSLLEFTHNSDNKEYIAPHGDLEENIAKVWKRLLKISQVGRDDNFFALGGTSFLAFQMIYQVKKELGLPITISDLFQYSSIAKLAEKNKLSLDQPFVTLQAYGKKAPLFFVHPSGGGVICYTEFAQLLKDRPLYAFQSPGYMEDSPLLKTVEAMAEQYLKVLLDQEHKEFWLGGWSFGGIVAFEMARLLKIKGYDLNPLILIDSPAPTVQKNISEDILLRWFMEDYGENYNQLNDEIKQSLFNVFRNNIEALSAYSAPEVSIDIFQMKAKNIYLEQLEIHPAKQQKDWGWGKFSNGTLKSYMFDADHSSILQKNYVVKLVNKIEELITKHKK